MAVTARLDVEQAAVAFGTHDALAGVDLHVAPAEVVAVLGPSGSGKTTLLRAVAGLQALDAGSVAIDGVDQAGVPPHRRGVGLMFQDHALFPHRDVGGTVAFGLRMQGMAATRIDARVAEVLALVDLPGTQRRPIASLSGGEQQRVALARALAPSPRVLLLDEPMGALDRTLRERLVAELRAVFTQLGLTVVAVTHDLREAFALADRIVVMDGGRVLRAGRPNEVWEQPATRRVAELLGLANLVDVEVVGGSARTPWGPTVDVAVADGPATVLVRDRDVTLSEDGPIEGAVRASTFLGDLVVLELDVPGRPSLRLQAATGAAPAVGSAVRVALPPTATALAESVP